LSEIVFVRFRRRFNPDKKKINMLKIGFISSPGDKKQHLDFQHYYQVYPLFFANQ
jgi:hypothetical protein